MPRLRFVSSVEGVNTIELEEPLITIGRGANNVVCIEDANISKHHALLIHEDDTYKLIDLHSVNGTCVNGQRITVARLKEGDAVRIGYLELTYEIAAPAARPVLGAPGTIQPAQPAAPLLGARPRLGFGVSAKPTPSPTSATVEMPPAAPAAPPLPPQPAPVTAHAAVSAAPVQEEGRVMIQVPAEKKHLVTGPPPTTAHALGGPPRPKPALHHETPSPAPAPIPQAVDAAQPTIAPPVAEPITPEPPAAEQPPASGPKKFGLAPSPGGAPKFRLKRE